MLVLFDHSSIRYFLDGKTGCFPQIESLHSHLFLVRLRLFAACLVELRN
jgi:hypothetical protein